jgi:hypothetical protein
MAIGNIERKYKIKGEVAYLNKLDGTVRINALDNGNISEVTLEKILNDPLDATNYPDVAYFPALSAVGEKLHLSYSQFLFCLTESDDAARQRGATKEVGLNKASSAIGFIRRYADLSQKDMELLNTALKVYRIKK